MIKDPYRHIGMKLKLNDATLVESQPVGQFSMQRSSLSVVADTHHKANVLKANPQVEPFKTKESEKAMACDVSTNINSCEIFNCLDPSC